jgi:hypothetical protein
VVVSAARVPLCRADGYQHITATQGDIATRVGALIWEPGDGK